MYLYAQVLFYGSLQKEIYLNKRMLFLNGSQGIILLHDVPIWYELWRNINAFPPDYYEIEKSSKKEKEKKK